MTWCARGGRAHGVVARSPAARCYRQAPVCPRGGAGQGGGGRSAPERWVNGEVAHTASGGRAPVVVDECGEALQLEGDKG
jgi:hypothetical protein